jgi:hypothetical protein
MPLTHNEYKYRKLLELRPDLVSRIHSYIEPGNFDDCWKWNKGHDKYGYAQFTWRYEGKQHNIKVHRLLWYLATGKLPEDVKHLCNNKSCVNIHHLQGDTHFQNMQDAMNDGLLKRNHLSQDDVRQIHILRSQGFTQQAIASHLGTSHVQVSRILSGRSRHNIYKEFHP